jgi:hypothetical protein
VKVSGASATAIGRRKGNSYRTGMNERGSGSGTRKRGNGKRRMRSQGGQWKYISPVFRNFRSEPFILSTIIRHNTKV